MSDVFIFGTSLFYCRFFSSQKIYMISAPLLPFLFNISMDKRRYRSDHKISKGDEEAA